MRAALPSLLLVSVALFCAAAALPQGETTSAIAGQVTDATNAAIPGAVVGELLFCLGVTM